MKYEPIPRQPARDPESLAGDFGLLLDAFADAFRGLSSSSRLESRWSQLRSCGGEC
jgi:hypothetical protein